MALRAGNTPPAGRDTTTQNPSPEAPSPFLGLTIGRIVHVIVPLPPDERIVERPAIVTDVHDRKSGLISAQVFFSPEDGVDSLVLHEHDLEPRPLGARIRFDDHPRRNTPATWHWPERA